MKGEREVEGGGGGGQEQVSQLFVSSHRGGGKHFANMKGREKEQKQMERRKGRKYLDYY